MNQQPIIPKPLKRYKGEIFMSFTIYDLGIFSLSCMALILIWVFFGISFWPKFALTMFLISAPLMLSIPLDGQKGYTRIYRMIKYLFSKKIYSKKQTHLFFPYAELKEDGYIKLKTGGYILPIELTGYNIAILQEKEQFSRIQSFQEFLKSNADTFSIIKCTLPNNLKQQRNTLEQIHKKVKSNKKLKVAAEMNLDILSNIEEKELNYTDKYFILLYGTKKRIEIHKHKILSQLSFSYLDPKQATNEVSNQIINYYYNLKSNQNINDIKQIHFYSKYIVIQTKDKTSYTRILAIYELPLYAYLGWLNNLNQGSDTSWSLTFETYNKLKATKKIDKVIKRLEEKKLGAKKASQHTQQDVYLEGLHELNERLHANGEIIHSTYNFIKVNADSLKELDEKTADVISELRSSQIQVTRLKNLQKDGFESILPKSTLTTKKITSIELPTIVSALGFPFYAESLRDPEGIYLGYTDSNSNIFFDPFHRTDYRKNSNAFILGTSGAGKSTLGMKLIKDQALKGTRVFIIDPEREYKQLCEKLDGTWINFGSDKSTTKKETKINPLQFFKDETGDRALLSSHLQFLEQFFKTLYPSLTLIETNVLKDVLIQLYKSKKITTATSINKLNPKDFPTLEELSKLIKKNLKNAKGQHQHALDSLNIYFQTFTIKDSPEYQLWNGYTNFNTHKSKFIVMDTHSLGESGNVRISNSQLFLLLKLVNNIMVQNKYLKEQKSNMSSKIMIVIDEAHLLIDEKQPFGLDFMYQMVKRARKYDTMTLITTQNVSDFVGGSLEVQKKTSAIINTSQYSFLLGMNPGDIENLDKVYSSIGGLTKLEKQTLSSARQGKGILGIGPKERKIIQVDLSDEELELLEH